MTSDTTLPVGTTTHGEATTSTGPANAGPANAGHVNAGGVNVGAMNAGGVSAGAANTGAAKANAANAGTANAGSAGLGTASVGIVNAGAANAGPATADAVNTDAATGAPSRSHAERRAELASFLRSRRERVTPEDVGLPPGPRRRTPGLRREEVAQLAGVGVTWYTWLEQGRRINASTQVLDAIARTLRLDLAEREHLYRLAEIPAVAAAVGAADVPDDVRRVLDGLAHLPASIVNSRQDILAWNSPYAKVFPGIVSQPIEKRNSLWVTFAYPGCCNPFVNRAERGPRLVAQLRAAYARHLGEPRWVELIDRLIRESAEFARLWQTHDVAGPGAQLKVMRNLAVGRLDMRTTSFEVHGLPEARMIVYLPLDEQTERLIAELCAGPGGGMVCPDCHRPGR